MPNCAINDIELRWFINYLFRSGKFIQDANFPRPFGYYSWRKRMRLEGMIAQSTITCFFVTDVGKLPPVTPGRERTESIITAIIPSHVQTQSQLHSSYTQTVSSVHYLKRKRLHQASTLGAKLSPATRPQLVPTHPNLATRPQAPIEQITSLATCSHSTDPNTQSTSDPQVNSLPQDSITVPTTSMPVITHQSYWFYPEARKLFGLMERDKDYDVQMLMHERLSKFKMAALTYDGWKLVMEDGDVKRKCHQTFIFNIRKKIQVSVPCN